MPGKPTSEPCPWGDRDWTEYYDAVSGKPARETTLKAIEVVRANAEVPRVAVDIGAGEGRDTAALLDAGFKVLAIDPHPEASRRIAERIVGLNAATAGRLDVVIGGAESLDAAVAMRPVFERCGVVNASFSLPFVRPERYARAWSTIRRLMAPGGVFAGQFFGERDSWASIEGRSHHSRQTMDELLFGLEVIECKEDEKDGHDATGRPKHWHVYHVVARQR